MKKAVIIIPTYNERENIAQIIPRIFAAVAKVKNFRVEILVVDDTSPDKTYQVVKQLQKKYARLHLLLNREKAGLGGAYLKGMAEAFGPLKADYIFEFDADGSHDPEKLPEFFAKLEAGYDFVIGGRYKDGGSIDPAWPLLRKFYSVVGNLVIMFVLTDFRIRDWTSGYRAISRRVYEAVIPEMKGERFSGYTWQIGFLHQAVRRNFKFCEVPIHFQDRQIGESKLGSEYIKNTLIYIFKARAQEIWRHKIFRFLCVGGIGFGVQFLIFNLLRQKISPTLATPLSTEVAIGSNFLLNNFWTFNQQRISGWALGPQFLKFNLASLGSVIIQTLVVSGGLKLAPNFHFFYFDSANTYLGIGILLGLIWNFFAYSHFIWRDKKPPPKTKSKTSLWRRFYQQQPLTFWLLLTLTLIGAGLRFYNLPETMMFLGDQGRDALVVSAMFKHFDPAFIGPVTSVGNMYLGPFYYYFMLPFLWLTYPSPLGPTLGVALVNTLFIPALYFWGRELVGRKAALWASFFATFSQLAINFSRFSWNPNLSPFFSLLFLFCLHQAATNSPKTWWAVALVGGVLIQLHYVNLILLVAAGLVWLYQVWSQRRTAGWFKRQHFWRATAGAILVFALTLVPLLLFDFKHGWRNLQAGGKIFSQEESFTPRAEVTNFGAGFVYTLSGFSGSLTHLYATLSLPQIELLNNFSLDVYAWRLGIAWGIFLIWLASVFFARRQKYAPGLMILTLVSVLSVVALGAYQHSVFDHYVIFFLPVLFLSLGYLLARLESARKVYLLVAVVVSLVYLGGNYRPGFYVGSGPTYMRTREIVQTLLGTIEPEATFNFVAINDLGDTQSDHFRFFFDAFSDNLVPLEQAHTADYLFVIDETRSADLYDNGSSALVIYRNQAGATFKSIPYAGAGEPLLYRFEVVESQS